MSRGLADGYLRYRHGQWLDCDGDPVEIELVVHARWEFRRSERFSWCTDVVCTACKSIIDTHIDNDMKCRQAVIRKKLLRCPQCGAHMDEEVDE